MSCGCSKSFMKGLHESDFKGFKIMGVTVTEEGYRFGGVEKSRTRQGLRDEALGLLTWPPN